MRVGWSKCPPRSKSGPRIAVEGAAAFDRITIKVGAREFDEIASGARRQIRLPMTRHWARVLVGKNFKNLVLNRSHLMSMQIAIPWPGYSVELVRSALMEMEVAVYTIDVSGAALPPSDAHAAAGGPFPGDETATTVGMMWAVGGRRPVEAVQRQFTIKRP